MKKQRFGKRASTIDRFNASPEESNFLRIFQIAMKEKLMLIECGEYNHDEFNRYLWRKLRRTTKYFDLKIKPLLLSCKVSPKFYLDIQETARKMFGDYVAMDDLIIFLLDYFVENYGKENCSEGIPLFKEKCSGGNNFKLNSFNAKFGRFYKNHVVSFKSQ